MKYLRCPQYLFALLKIRPSLDKRDYLRKFWIGYPMKGDTQLDHAFILQWDLDDIPQPTQDEIMASWESSKDEYIDPFSTE